MKSKAIVLFVMLLVARTGVAIASPVAPIESNSEPQTAEIIDDSGMFGPDSGAARVAIASASAPPGFVLDVIWSGLTLPTVVQFAGDGRAFVAEKSGVIKAFDSIDDPTPVIAANLSNNVHNFWDRGLLGLAVDPNFPTRPYLYALYSLDVGNTWGDGCPTPPGATNDGCVVNGRLSRIQIDPATNTQVGQELPLIQGLFCSQYPSHAIGSVVFGSDGALYISSGDGASFNFADYGQGGGDPGSPTPVNPCNDPDPTPGAGGVPTLPDAEGGALRSQDILTLSDPVTLDGAILRVHPDTGNAMAGNPLIGGATSGDDRIIAHGLRNPFRLTQRPGTSEIWIGDVGWGGFEEINRIPNPTNAVVENFGWPCYEGAGRQGSYDGLNVNLCEGLYSGSIPSTITSPYLAIAHGSPPDPSGCTGGGASISGLAFNESGHYPTAYDNALFFGDYSWKCVWVMFANTSGNPSPSQIDTFVSGVGVVHLTTGPGGDLYMTDFDTGEIVRVTYPAGNEGPTALITANPISGPAPLSVQFDGSGSSDPEGDQLTYNWDLNGDGNFGDSSSAAPQFTYTAAGQYLVQLRVTDDFGSSGVDTQLIDATSVNTPPTATITSPSSTFTWRVGESIPFSGTGADTEDGPLPASAFLWQLNLHHCDGPTDCHVHVIETRPDVSSGNFVAPDHEYPAFLEIVLTVTDSSGLDGLDSQEIQPETVDLSFASVPTGLALTVGTTTSSSPFTETFIVGSTNTITAPSPQSQGGTSYVFNSWSDGGGQSHDIVAPAAPTTYTATYGPGACGGLVQEGEDGVLLGGFVVGSEASASGGQFVRTPQGFGNSLTFNPANGVEFCVSVPTAGTYDLRATVNSPNSGANSLWVRVDGANQFAWNFPVAASYVDRQVVSLTLSAGDHIVGFYNREDGTKLDLMALVGGPVVNDPPNAAVAANPTSGSAPLQVQFDGSASSDPEGGPLTFDWDLDGDGAFGDSSVVAPSFTYTSAGSYLVRLRVADAQGQADVETITINVSSGTCGGLVHEAEAGVLLGGFVIGSEASASGGQFVRAPQGFGNSLTFNPANGVEFCVSVPAAGTYELRATVKTPNSGANSLWVRVDGANEFSWNSPVAASYVDRPVISLTLAAGDHVIGFYNREDGTQLDRIEVRSLGAAGGLS